VSDDEIALTTLPTPLVRAPRLEAWLGCGPLYVKRDDLAGFAVAGTKARALQALVADAHADGCDALVVAGGPSSNLVGGAAVAGAVTGLDVVAVLSGHGPGRRSVTGGLLARMGAEVVWTGAAERASVDRALPQVTQRLAREGRRAYQIPRGAATGVGTAGVAHGAAELAGQLTAAGVASAAVVVATGSGGSQAALVAGAAAGGHRWRVVGVSVSRPVEEARHRVARLARDSAAHLGWAAPDEARVEVRDGRGPGFAVPSPAGQWAAQAALAREGLVLDPVYTAKAMAALPQVAAETGGPVVFWHSGGTAAACHDLLSAAPAAEVAS
jgi:D-cysteine desulfhydrase